MATPNPFDVLVVYSERIAKSAVSKNYIGTTPFRTNGPRNNYNDAYSYFLSYCAKNNLKAAFSTSGDIIGPGICNSYWLYSDKEWGKVDKKCSSKLIFDKFSPTNTKRGQIRDKLFSSKKIASFSDKYLFELFFDKYQTYRTLADVAIPTVIINRSDVEGSITRLRNKLKKHSNTNDFSNKFVLKDRFGAGGIKVYKIDGNIQDKIEKILKKNKKTSFVLQPLIEFDRGYKHKSRFKSIDIRLIFKGKKIIQTYLRVARSGEFRCNEHQGGKLIYTPKKEIPTQVLELGYKIASKLSRENAIYALDFIISNNKNVYLLEGNIGPGLDWDLASKENERGAKKLIKLIVHELARRKNS